MWLDRKSTGTYEVDTVEFDGRVVTTEHPVVGMWASLSGVFRDDTLVIVSVFRTPG